MKKAIVGSVVTFSFGEGVAPIVVDVSGFSQAVREYAVPFAFGHRLGDNAAGCKTEAERRAAVQELADYYGNGAIEWNMKSTTPRAPAQDQTILKLSVALGLTYDATMARVAAAAMAELSAQPAV